MNIILQIASTPGTSVNYSNVPLFENFDAQKEKFVNYIERFENYINLKGITGRAMKAQFLSNSIGSGIYNNLAPYLGPNKTVKELNYEELITNLKQMLVPLRSVVISQHYFLNEVQKNGQSLAEYVASLQSNLADCYFDTKCLECGKQVSVSSLFLRAQFIRGLQEPWIREKLLQSRLTEFEEIVEKAISWEAARLESHEFTKQNQTSESSLDTAPVRQQSRVHQRLSHSRRYSAVPKTPSRLNSQRSRIDYKKIRISGLCLHGARNNHSTSDCRIPRNILKCKSCSKEGYIDRVCISSLMKKSREQKHSSSTKTINDTFSENSVYKNEPQWPTVELHYSDSHQDEEYEKDEKYYVNVEVNNRPLRMEVDSGARFSLIAEDTLQKLNLRTPTQPTRIAFKSYSGDITPSRGKVHVTVAYKNAKMRGTLFVVPAGHDTILGRTWIRKLHIDLATVDRDRSFLDNEVVPVSEIRHTSR